MALSIRTRMLLEQINEKHLEAIKTDSEELQKLFRVGFGGQYPEFEPTKYAALLNTINGNIRLIGIDLYALSACDDKEKKEVMKRCATIIEAVNKVYERISQLYAFHTLSPLDLFCKVCTPTEHLTYLGTFTKGYEKLKNSEKIVEQKCTPKKYDQKTEMCLAILHAINKYRIAVMEDKNNESSIKTNIENLVDQFIKHLKESYDVNALNENVEEVTKLVEILLAKFSLMDAFAEICGKEKSIVEKLKNLSKPSVSKLNSLLELIQNNWEREEKRKPSYCELKEENTREQPTELTEKSELNEYELIRSLR